jgi:hypothetical protein
MWPEPVRWTLRILEDGNLSESVSVAMAVGVTQDRGPATARSHRVTQLRGFYLEAGMAPIFEPCFVAFGADRRAPL